MSEETGVKLTKELAAFLVPFAKGFGARRKRTKQDEKKIKAFWKGPQTGTVPVATGPFELIDPDDGSLSSRRFNLKIIDPERRKAVLAAVFLRDAAKLQARSQKDQEQEGEYLFALDALINN